MGKAIYKWSVRRLCRMIERMLSQKFDCIIIIEGERGLGKSTLGYLILKGVKHIIRQNPNGSEELGKIRFNPKKDILYTRKEIINAFNERWFSSFMADEMINVSFNRSFYEEDQKKLIRIINMNRDHCNLFVACVPQFQTLDNQIKNLCKIRITVVRRGVAIVQTKNRTLYNPDKWETHINEKIEREWFKSGRFIPKYPQLTTFRGVLRFRDLTPLERELYEEIKLNKRNIIKQEEAEQDKSNNPYDKLYQLLSNGNIPNKLMFDNLCSMMGVKPINAMSNIRIRMRNNQDYRKFQEFFTDDYEQVGEHGIMKKL